MRRWGLFAVLCAAFFFAHAGAASAKKQHPGPCRQGDVVSVVDRPGGGPAATTGGSPCTVLRGKAVVEVGYRNEVDVGKGGTSILSSYPMSLVRVGITKRDELIYAPPTEVIRGGATVPDLFTPSAGALDTGFGWKHNIQSHYWYQDAVEVFMTVPTGTNGHSNGGDTYTFSYIGAFSPPGKLGIFTSFSIGNAPGTPLTGGQPRRFASYTPALSLSYAISSNTSAIVSDTESLPVNPTGGASNVLVLALQRTISPGVVVDIESEYNLTPNTGYNERAIGLGGAFSL
jgi:hypothetical protein